MALETFVVHRANCSMMQPKCPPALDRLRGKIFWIIIFAVTLTRLSAVSQSSSPQVNPNDPIIEKARKHPSYQVFALNLGLPSIAVLNENSLQLAEKYVLEFGRGVELTKQQAAEIGQAYNVSEALIFSLHRRYSSSPRKADQLKRHFQNAITDYRFLEKKWNQYKPPAGSERLKSEALELLKTGDVEHVWILYHNLPKPDAPGRAKN
jgi:hypothetical protein